MQKSVPFVTPLFLFDFSLLPKKHERIHIPKLRKQNMVDFQGAFPKGNKSAACTGFFSNEWRKTNTTFSVFKLVLKKGRTQLALFCFLHWGWLWFHSSHTKIQNLRQTWEVGINLWVQPMRRSGILGGMHLRSQSPGLLGKGEGVSSLVWNHDFLVNSSHLPTELRINSNRVTKPKDFTKSFLDSSNYWSYLKKMTSNAPRSSYNPPRLKISQRPQPLRTSFSKFVDALESHLWSSEPTGDIRILSWTNQDFLVHVMSSFLNVIQVSWKTGVLILGFRFTHSQVLRIWFPSGQYGPRLDRCFVLQCTFGWSFSQYP